MPRRALILALTALLRGDAVADELLGNSAAAAAPVPAAIRREDGAFATWRQGKEFGYRLELPPGKYELELGFLELIWRQPGQRVFQIVIDGKPVADPIDMVAAAGKAPSRLVKTLPIEVGPNGLEVRLSAASDEAPLAFLRVRDAAGERVRDIDCGGDADLDPPSVNSPLSEQILPRFGSGALLDLRPQFGDAILSPVGRFPAEPIPIAIGIEVEGVEYALPFARKLSRYRPFSSVQETRTACSVRYAVEAPGVRATIEFLAPFHPGDLVGSGLPCFPVRFELDSRRTDPPPSVRALVFLGAGTGVGRDVDLPAMRGRVFRSRAPQSTTTIQDVGVFVARRALSSGAKMESTPRGVRISLPLTAGAEAPEVLFAVQRVGELLKYRDEPYSSAIQVFGKRIEEQVAEFEKRRPLLEAAGKTVDSLVEEATVPESLKALLRVALPSFLMNTVLGNGPDGKVYYACAEGYCRYHATLDVEAHTLPFYTWFAPDLLERAIEQWNLCLSEDGVMCHDIGKDGTYGAQQYPHAMPIEENTNFVLLLHAYVTRTGNREFGSRFADRIALLLGVVEATDTDGDLFPDQHCANTIDDGSAAVQYSREQTYLAAKMAVAYLAGADLLRGLPEYESWCAKHDELGKELGAAVDARAWRGTHYALTVDPSAKGLINPWTSGIADVVPVESAGAGNPLEDALEGADSASGLVALGAHFAVGSFLDLPFSREQLSLDLQTANARTARRFVLAHAEHEINGWVSLSLLRDAVATRLGAPVLANCERYAALQVRRNRLDDREDWAGFCDSPYNRYLAYYPRGVAALSLVEALVGVRFDARSKRLELTPAQAPLRIPLPQFADWKTLNVPWLAVRIREDGTPQATITEPAPFEGIDVTIDLTKVGGKRESWRR